MITKLPRTALRRCAGILAVGAVVSALTACSGEVSVGSKPKPLPADKVAATVKTKLTEQSGQTPEDVTCPEDLPSKKGAEITCVLTASDGQLDVKVTVTSVKDGTTNFDIEVLPPAAG